jgi:PAS domain S-box-containing protein
MADPSHPYIEDHRVGGSWIRQGPQVKSCLGYAPEDGSTPNFCKTRLHPADRDRVLAEDERCDQTLEPFRSTYRVFARDGRTVWLRDEAELVYDDSGEPSYWQGVYVDITDHTMAQHETARRLAAGHRPSEPGRRLARRSSASSGRCITNSLRIRSSRAWLAVRQLGSLGALVRFGVHRFGRAVTRAWRRGARKTSKNDRRTIKRANAPTAIGPAGRGVHLDKRVPAFSRYRA